VSERGGRACSTTPGGVGAGEVQQRSSEAQEQANKKKLRASDFTKSRGDVSRAIFIHAHWRALGPCMPYAV
jgi:hypothetical protein